MKKLLIILTLSSSLIFSGCDILLPLLESVAESGVSLEPTNTEIIAGLLPGEVVVTEGSGVLRAELLKGNLGAG